MNAFLVDGINRLRCPGSCSTLKSAEFLPNPFSFHEGGQRHAESAHHELFRRSPDERFESLDTLASYCRAQKTESTDRWHLPQHLAAKGGESGFFLEAGNDGAYLLNDWSFGQLCSLARVSKETVNRLSTHTAGLVFRETLPRGEKPLQVLTASDRVRSIHGVAYTRLWNSEVLSVVQEFATDFTPPQKGINGGTGLYAGEQDMFCFLIDPAGWAEIEGEAFAPGFFVWNSEVGKRTVGISTFWFQAVCANHIVWDAVEVTEFSRKHTANVHEALSGNCRGESHLREFIQLIEFGLVVSSTMQDSINREYLDHERANGSQACVARPHGIAPSCFQIIEEFQDRRRFDVHKRHRDGCP